MAYPGVGPVCRDGAGAPKVCVYFYHNDRLGTPELMTDSNKMQVWKADYDAFGEAAVDPASTVVNNFRFPGQYYDAETGLHYNGHRYYDPKTGRYLTPDPVGLEGGINPYAYAVGDPVNKIDPSGLKTWQIGIGFGAGGIFGSTKSAGIIVGHNPKSGTWEFGLYATGGAGLYGGASASLTVDYTISDNPCVDDVGGWAGTAGFSVGAGLTGGYERNSQMSGTLPSNTFSFGLGVGTLAEGHGYATYTTIWK